MDNIFDLIDVYEHSNNFSYNKIKNILQNNYNIINNKNKYGETILQSFCNEYFYEIKRDTSYNIIKLLFEYNANPNVVDIQGKTPLYNILNYGLVDDNDIEIVKLFIDNDVNVDLSSPIIPAIECCSFDIINLLINNGANCSIKNNDKINLIDIYLNNSCNEYTDCEYLKTIKLLIHNGVDINERTCGDYTPFTSALELGCDIEIIKLFIDNGADLNLTYENKTILELCDEFECHTEIIEFIKSKISN